ncbi:MAG: hypothetical protein H0W16_14725 [Actinobacteria bacterium]|nr:hypothetical protein [Actinomycetota bacterium]
MLDWLDQVQERLDRFAGDSGAGASVLSPADIELLLELARSAAHETGQRTNAPLVAYLVGYAHGRSPETELQDLVAAALDKRDG